MVKNQGFNSSVMFPYRHMHSQSWGRIGLLVKGTMWITTCKLLQLVKGEKDLREKSKSRTEEPLEKKIPQRTVANLSTALECISVNMIFLVSWNPCYRYLFLLLNISVYSWLCRISFVLQTIGDIFHCMFNLRSIVRQYVYRDAAF